MPVTLHHAEILSRANHFAKEFAHAHYELGEAQNFIRGLCDVFGFSHKRLVSFEQRVKKLGGGRGRIDGFYPGQLLIEMKSRGEKLDLAYQQATDYLPGLSDAELPEYILVSDFAHMHLHRRDGQSPPLCHPLADFAKYIDHYLFLAGYEAQAQQAQIAVDESAARKIAQLHDAMRAGGYTGTDLERYLVRLVFCLFAEDTGIFERAGSFARYIRQHSKEDGSDLDSALQSLFDVLDRAPAQRPKHLPQVLQAFPYINGSVFGGQLARCYFDASARTVLLDCAEHFDWSQISPAIFGSLFQAVVHHDGEGVTGKSSKRRELGAHYTSETNILRASRLLGGNFNRLPLARRANIVCANALTTDWATVLLPELCDYVVGNPPFVGKTFQSSDQKRDFSAVTTGIHGAGDLDFVAAWYVKAARYLADAAARTGQAPLAHEPAAPKSRPTPAPYAPQRKRVIRARTRCAFVSTNSIVQGEQVGVLWGWMLAQGMKIQFAHRTFQWSNDAKGVAAVHCVIIGFGTDDLPRKTIFNYPKIKGEPVAVEAGNINPYLVDAPDVVLSKRSGPLWSVSAMVNGSKPADGGNLLLDAQERAQLVSEEPLAEQWIRPFVGAEEFINGKKRYCIWLVNCPPEVLVRMPRVLARVQAVKAMRSASSDKQTNADAKTPTLFQKIRQPKSNFLLVPSVSSERRDYVPIGFLTPDTIISNLVYSISDASLFHFGIMASTMHNAWMRVTCGRLKSDYRYSANIVYNNFPWPDLPEPPATENAARPTSAQAANQKKRVAIEAAAQAVLDARASFPQASLADLYDPLAMPPALTKAHHQLDKAVDVAYAYKGQADDASRVAFLFGLYGQLTSALSGANLFLTSSRIAARENICAK